MFDKIRSILVARNIESHLGNSPSLFTGVRQGGFFKWLFCFVRLVVKRGHNPALVNVGATDTDKRVEPGLYSLLTLGIVKTGRGVRTPKLDKREHRPQWITLWITTRHLLCRVS